MSTRITKRALSLFLAVCMLFSTFTVTAFAATSTWTPAENTKIFVDVDSVDSFEDLKYEANFFQKEYYEKTGVTLGVTMGSVDEADSNDIILTYDSTVAHTQGYKVTVSGNQLTIAASGDDGLFYGWHYVVKQMVSYGKVSPATETPDVDERSVSLDNGRKYYSVEWIKQLIREMAWADMNTLVMHFSEEMGLGLETKLYPWLNGRDGRLCTQAYLDENFDDRYLTQAEFLEIAEFAKAYHIDLVPSLDSPGHMNYIVYMFNQQAQQSGGFTFSYGGKTYNTVYTGSTYKGYEVKADGSKTLVFTSKYGIGNYFSYNNTTAVVSGSSVPMAEFTMSQSRGIDISNEIAVAFTKSLIEEYGKLFYSVGATKIDIGGDELLGWGTAAVSTSTASRWQQLDHWKEYAQEKTGNTNAVAYDAFLLYMNDLNALVRGLGFTSVRMWNDDALRSSDTGWKGVVQLDTNIDIWFWTTGSNTVWTYAGAGYQVYNILSDYNYYAMTSDYFSTERGSFTQAYADQIYNEWCPYRFDPTNATLGTGKNTAIGNSNVLGGALGIWCDNPTLRTEDEVMSDILPMIRAIGAKSWDATENSDVAYATFTANWESFGAAAEVAPATITSFIPDASALRAAVKDAATVDSSAYGEISYNAYMDAVNAGQAILSRGATSQAEIDNAVVAIQNAKAALTTDKGALEAAVAEADSITEGMYSDETYAAYKQAVDAGRVVLANESATQKEIVDAYNAILAAKANLTADKSALQNELDQTPALDTIDPVRYAEVLDEYTKALNEAEAVLADPLATQQEVDAALAAFQYAKGYIFVDYSALEAEVAKADEIVPDKDIYAPFYYEDYMSLVEEAKTKYLAEDAYPFHQTHVDAMTSTLASARYNLVNYCTVEMLTKDLVAQIERYYKEDLPIFRAGGYTIESWMFYSSLIKGAETLLQEKYNYTQIEDRVELIEQYRLLLRPETPDITAERNDIINSASFQTSTSYAGSVVRMAVDTVRSYDVAGIIIIDENGFLVPTKAITYAPLNRRKPKSKIAYVDLILDVEPGTHTYTVYVSDMTSESSDIIFCGDPVDCTITVK